MRIAWGPIAVLAAAGLLFAAGPATAAPAGTNSPNLLDTIAAIAPAGLDAVANSPTTTSGPLAIAATTPNAQVTVPTDPAVGVKVTFDGRTLKIGLPFSTSAHHAVAQGPGVISYDNRNGSSSVPIVLDGGGIRINTVIAGPNAPQRYTYPLGLPPGAKIVKDGDGLLLFDANGASMGSLNAPWAIDAAGRQVPTHYEVKATTVTQVIEHGPGTTYPVVADPEYWPPVTIWWPRDQVESAWRVLGYQNTLCMIPIPWWLMGACYHPATQADAIASAHYQSKRIMQVYYGCKSASYCNYSDWYVRL